MSTAQAEKVVSKPVAPLGSFLNKLTPAPVEKKPTEPAKEVADATPKTPAVSADAGKPAGAVGEKPPATTVPIETPAAPATPAADSDPTGQTDKTEKRLKDAQTWGNEEHKARLAAEREARDLKTRLDRIEQKLDGTYEAPSAPSAEQVAYDAEMRGKLRASHRAAVRKYGEEYVLTTVWNPDSPYMKLQAANPHVAQRVQASEDPVQEALDVLKEEEDAKKYGRTSEEMRKKIEAELKPQLEQQILQGLKTKPGPEVNNMGIVRGSTERTSQKADAPAGLNLGLVFPWGAARR